MPDYPPAGDWTTWIIGTLMAVVSTVVATAVTLARMIESKYQQELIELRKDSVNRETRYAKDIEELKKESKACQEDRYTLAIRVASLEAATKKNTSDISDIK
jgi:hypothetical protein